MVAAEYKNGWIPCSVVDHPEHCRECEVTMVNTHGYTREIAFFTDRWRRFRDEAEIIVVAWKEPSDPYQPKGEREKCNNETDISICSRFEDGSEYIKRTNADRIRSMSDEEFAEFWLKHCDNPIMNFNEDICDLCDIYGNESDEKCDDDYCIKAIVKWLQAEVNSMSYCNGSCKLYI